MMGTEKSGETPPRRTFVAIGGFRPVDESQATGGQQTACAALFSTPLATRHQWLYVDTTASGAEAKHRSDRVKRGLGRLGQLAQYGVRRDVAGALIFTSAHLSFVEKGLVAVAMKRAGKRVVFCPRSGLILDDWNRSATFRHFLPWVFRHCDAVVCQGQSWRRRFIDMGADPDTLEVIPNWIDPGWQFNMTPREANTISARKQVRFLFVGRLEAYKGIWDLLDAIVARRHQLAGCVFELAGGGSCESELRRRIALHGLQDQVILRGWIGGEVKRNAFRDADCLVLPSHREGMPNVVLEAMAAQVPVLATDVGGDAGHH